MTPPHAVIGYPVKRIAIATIAGINGNRLEVGLISRAAT